MTEALECYEAAIAEAERVGEQRVLTQALRHIAIARCQRGAADEARQLCRRSYDIAMAAGEQVLAAEALNTLATIDLHTGALEHARTTYARALALGGDSLNVRARTEQNLGVLANIHGALDDALAHYRRSLEAYESLRDDHGCAIAYHNLGMISADRELWDEADRYFQRGLALAQTTGDHHLEGLCLVNYAEVDVARQRYDDARRRAEQALAIFDQLGIPSAKSEAYRMIGLVYRETGRLALAESRLRMAVDLAVQSGVSLNEAESSRELALLYQAMGRNQDALTLLNGAYRLFQDLDARVDLVDVQAKVAALESTYLAVVREWGQSIESSDSYTHGHCERVATYAVNVATMLGMDADEITAIRIGAYLHDVGKTRVPHEILNKPGALTRDEFEVMQMHTVWGIELLAGIEFPWDIKPIIRWHHEKYDGSGYPDRLRGDEIPLSAQVVGIADVFDALTTTRAYRAAFTHEEAREEILRCRHWWSPEVVDAFLTSIRDEAGARAA